MLAPLVEFIFLTTFYGLYFKHQFPHYIIQFSSSSYMFMVTFCGQIIRACIHKSAKHESRIVKDDFSNTFEYYPKWILTPYLTPNFTQFQSYFRIAISGRGTTNSFLVKINNSRPCRDLNPGLLRYQAECYQLSYPGLDCTNLFQTFDKASVFFFLLSFFRIGPGFSDMQILLK